MKKASRKTRKVVFLPWPVLQRGCQAIRQNDFCKKSITFAARLIQMNDWNNFFIATAGAAATLTGLIFVGVSISLNKILSVAALPARAFISLLLLLTMLVLSILTLVPHQSFTVLGMETLITGFAAYVTILIMDILIIRNKANQYKRLYILNMLLNQISLLPYLVSGTLLVCKGEQGMYWLAPAIVFSFIKSVMDAWVLLVEINR